MNQKKITVTIGIPAYNEEGNIGALLQTVLSQEETNFILKQIIVVSDKSSDKTDEITTGFKNSRIVLLRNKKRSGQVYSQNKIFKRSDTDIVVLLEADTHPQGTLFLHDLIQPMIMNPEIGLVQGNVRPLPSESILGKILERQVNASYHFMITAPDVENWLSSGRGGRAFAKFVYQNLHWPSAVPEDVYAFLWCRRKGITCVFQRLAICKYKIPQQFTDLIRERQKTRSGEKALRQYFSEEYFEMIYRKPKSYMIKPLLYFLFRYPLAFIGYIMLKIRLYKNITNRKFTDFWPTTYSTKILKKY